MLPRPAGLDTSVKRSVGRCYIRSKIVPAVSVKSWHPATVRRRYFILACNIIPAYQALLIDVPDVAHRYTKRNRDPNPKDHEEAWARLNAALYDLAFPTFQAIIWEQSTGLEMSDPTQGLRFSTGRAAASYFELPPNPFIATRQNRTTAIECLHPYTRSGTIADVDIDAL